MIEQEETYIVGKESSLACGLRDEHLVQTTMYRDARLLLYYLLFQTFPLAPSVTNTIVTLVSPIHPFVKLIQNTIVIVLVLVLLPRPNSKPAPNESIKVSSGRVSSRSLV